MEISAYRYRQARFCCAKLSEELRMRYVSFFMAEKAYHVAAFATIHAESRTGCPDGLCYLYRVGCSYGDLLESARALGHIIVFMKMRSPHGIAVFNIAARKRIAAIRIIPPFFS
jgi:hypothetical protein